MCRAAVAWPFVLAFVDVRDRCTEVSRWPAVPSRPGRRLSRSVTLALVAALSGVTDTEPMPRLPNRLACVTLFATAFTGVVASSVLAQAVQAPESPLLFALQREVAAGKSNALRDFW